MTIKVLRPYSREEVLSTLRAKVPTGAQAARSFAPGGLSAASVFANRRAANSQHVKKTTGGFPASRETSAEVFSSKFAANVFSARRGDRAPAPSCSTQKEPASQAHTAVAAVTSEAPRANGADSNVVSVTMATDSVPVEAAKDVIEAASFFGYADLTGRSSTSNLQDVIGRACGFVGS